MFTGNTWYKNKLFSLIWFPCVAGNQSLLFSSKSLFLSDDCEHFYQSFYNILQLWIT